MEDQMSGDISTQPFEIENVVHEEQPKDMGEPSSVEATSSAMPPALPPKPVESPLMRPSSTPGAGWLRIVGSYRKGVLQIVIEEFRRLGYRLAPTEVSDDQISLFWSRSFFQKLPFLKAHQKVNWMPGMNEICRKDILGKNITLFAKRFGDEHFSFWPKSFNLPREWNAFIEEFNARPIPYILKPPLAARGEGIRLFTNLEDASEGDEYIQTKIPLAQRYIPNPLLFHGKYKMSFRFYVALTSVDPLRIYMYQDGLVRICSTPYTNSDYGNLLIHLTNYDLQVVNEANFVETMKTEETECRLDGLRADWQEVKSMLQRQGHDVERMWSDIQDLVVKSFLAAEIPLTRSVKTFVKTRGTAYEVTGFDVLLDEDLKPWLLEVNHTPSLCPHTDLENDIKRNMLRDLYQLVDIERKHLASTRIRHEQLLSLWKQQKAQHQFDSSPLSTSPISTSTQTIASHPNGAMVTEAINFSTDNRFPSVGDAGAPAESQIILPVDPSILNTLLSETRINVESVRSTTSSNGNEAESISANQNRGSSRRSSVGSTASSTTGFHAGHLDFPTDEHGSIQPDRFVGSDLWTIVDTAEEVCRLGLLPLSPRRVPLLRPAPETKILHTFPSSFELIPNFLIYWTMSSCTQTDQRITNLNALYCAMER
jgi:hypothetical protein